MQGSLRVQVFALHRRSGIYGRLNHLGKSTYSALVLNSTSLLPSPAVARARKQTVGPGNPPALRLYCRYTSRPAVRSMATPHRGARIAVLSKGVKDVVEGAFEQKK